MSDEALREVQCPRSKVLKDVQQLAKVEVLNLMRKVLNVTPVTH